MAEDPPEYAKHTLDAFKGMAQGIKDAQHRKSLQYAERILTGAKPSSVLSGLPKTWCDEVANIVDTTKKNLTSPEVVWSHIQDPENPASLGQKKQFEYACSILSGGKNFDDVTKDLHPSWKTDIRNIMSSILNLPPLMPKNS